MPKADPNKNFALRESTITVLQTIARLRRKVFNTIHYDITEQDLVSAMYGDSEATARGIYPLWVSLLGSRHKYHRYGDELHNCMVRIDNDAITLPLLPYDLWRGSDDAKFALVHKVGEVVDRMRHCMRQWDKVANAFDYFNSHCKTPNQLRSMWPPVIQLLEYAGYDQFVQSLGPYKAYAPPIDLTASQMNDIRETVSIVGIALMLPDDIGECESFAKIGL